MSKKDLITVESAKEEQAEAKAQAILSSAYDSLPITRKTIVNRLIKELADAGNEAQYIQTENGLDSVYTPAELEAIKVAVSQNEIPYRFQVYKGCYFLVKREEKKIMDGADVILSSATLTPDGKFTEKNKYTDL